MEQSNLNKDVKFIVFKYTAGYANSDEVREVEAWLEESAANKRYFDEIKDIWQTIITHHEGDEFDELVAWKKFQTKIHASQSSNDSRAVETRAGIRKQSIILLRKYWQIAAAVLIFVSFSINGVFILREKNADQGITEMVCPLGSKTQLSLPDGTQVWLNSGSRISYNGEFNQKNREVYLEGEGFFDVTKNQKKPFIVQTSDIDILVTGTSFNVKAYPEEGSIETTLIQGEITIHNKSVKQIKPMKLLPRQKAIYIRDEGRLAISPLELNSIQNQTKLEKKKVIITNNADVEINTGWKDQKLVFKNESFENMLSKIERWYGVKIILMDEEIKKLHFNGTIEDETIHEVMNILQLTLPITYTFDHKIITINKNENPNL